MVAYIRRHPEIRDALVSGGDPLTLPPDRLDYILSSLRSIDHLEIIRVGSRVPVVMPMAITDETRRHSREVRPRLAQHSVQPPPGGHSAAAAAAVDRLLRAGIPVNNQSVLLRGVNDSPAADDRPQPGPSQGQDTALLPLSSAIPSSAPSTSGRASKPVIGIMEALRGHTSGLAIPSYVIDLPGGGGKVPITPDYLIRRSEEGLWSSAISRDAPSCIPKPLPRVL